MKKHFVHTARKSEVVEELPVAIGDSIAISIDGQLPRSYNVVMANATHAILETTKTTDKRVLVMSTDQHVACMGLHDTVRVMGDVVGIKFDTVARKWVAKKRTTKYERAPVVVGDELSSQTRTITVRMICDDGSFAYEYEDYNDVIRSGFMYIKDACGSGVYGIEAVYKKEK